MKKYQIMLFREPVAHSVIKFNISWLSMLLMALLLVAVVVALVYASIRIVQQRSDIVALKAYEPELFVPRNDMEPFFHRLDIATGILYRSNEFIDNMFEEHPFISSQMDEAEFVRGSISPVQLKSLLYTDSENDNVSLLHLRKVTSTIDNELAKRLAKYDNLSSFLEKQAVIYAHTPNIWPSTKIITSQFAFRANPFSGIPSFHEGTDLGATTGTPNLSAADGVVVYAGARTGYGNMITIDHGFGYMTRYAHNSKLYVKAGDFVKKGQIVGAAGSTGRSAGSHLHYEVLYNGIPVNSLHYLPNEGRR